MHLNGNPVLLHVGVVFGRCFKLQGSQKNDCFKFDFSMSVSLLVLYISKFASIATVKLES